jgi:hypothetical protein
MTAADVVVAALVACAGAQAAGRSRRILVVGIAAAPSRSPAAL